MILELTLVVLGTVLVAEILRTHFVFRNALRHDTQSTPLERYPSVTVIRPIKGMDTGLEENLEAALNPNYPGSVETLFVFDDDSEPALPLVRRAVYRHNASNRPGRANVLFCGNPPAERTGKLHAMITGMQHAQGELVAFADSDIRPDGHALRTLVETLMTADRAGAAFAPVVSIAPALTSGDAGCSLLLNGLYGGVAAAVAHKRGGDLPFIMGEYMVFKREAITAIGGLESAEGQLVDDMYIGARIHAAGYRNVVSPCRVPIIQQGMNFVAFLKTFRRWIAFSRSGLPGWSFRLHAFIHAVAFWVALAGLTAAAALGIWNAAALLTLATLGVSISISRLNRHTGGAPLPVWAWPMSLIVLLIGPFVLLSVVVFPKVQWRGRTYRLNVRSHLATGDVLRPDEPRPSFATK